MKNIKVSALIMAAGNSTRMKSEISKQLISVCSEPVIAHTLRAFEKSRYIRDIIIVTREQDVLAMKDLAEAFGFGKVKKVVTGGETRQESVSKGLAEVEAADYIAVHDGARPCVTAEQIDSTVEAAHRHGCAALGCRVVDTLKRVENGEIISTVDREGLWQIQTPQIFASGIIKEAYANAKEKGLSVTDDTALLEAMNVPVVMVEGNASNIKVTTPEDVPLAEAILLGRRGGR